MELPASAVPLTPLCFTPPPPTPLLRFDSLTSFAFPLVSVGVLVRADAPATPLARTDSGFIVSALGSSAPLGNATPLIGSDGIGDSNGLGPVDALCSAAIQDQEMDPVFDAPPLDEHATLLADDSAGTLATEAGFADEKALDHEPSQADDDDDAPLAHLSQAKPEPAGRVLESVSDVWSNQAIVQAATAPFVVQVAAAPAAEVDDHLYHATKAVSDTARVLGQLNLLTLAKRYLAHPDVHPRYDAHVFPPFKSDQEAWAAVARGACLLLICHAAALDDGAPVCIHPDEIPPPNPAVLDVLIAVADVEGAVYLWDRLLEAWNKVPRRHRRAPSTEELQAQFERFALETLPALSVPGMHRGPAPDAGFTDPTRLRAMLRRIDGAMPRLEEIRAAAQH